MPSSSARCHAKIALLGVEADADSNRNECAEGAVHASPNSAFAQTLLLVPHERREQITDDRASAGLDFHRHRQCKPRVVGLIVPAAELRRLIHCTKLVGTVGRHNTGNQFGLAQRRASSAHAWQRRTNLWRRITSPARAA